MGEPTPAGHGAAGLTVVVPAHDEEAVLGRCLETLLSGARAGDLEVLVVSNGSTDGTVAVAQRIAAGAVVPVEVVDLPQASKVLAIREGMARSEGRAVIVLDADVILPTPTARALAIALDRREPVAASARMEVDTTRSGTLVRRYYRVWTALPYASRSMIGSGVFALNPAARELLGEFPDVTNDDGWVRRSVPADRRVVVDAAFVVHAARTARALVARRARIVNGNRELDTTLGDDPQGTGLRDVLAAGRQPGVGPLDVLAFLGVTVVSRALAARRRRRGDTSWSTDTTSRVAA